MTTPFRSWAGCPARYLDYLRASTYTDMPDAWGRSRRGDWMLNWAGACVGPPGDASRIPLVLAACECAEMVRQPASGRILLSIARDWTRGSVTVDDVQRALCARSKTNTPLGRDRGDWYAECAAMCVTSTLHLSGGCATADGALPFYAGRRMMAKAADIMRKHYPRIPDATYAN